MPELLADDIRRQIINGDLEPGNSLPTEKAMMEHYAVSRPTLREAMRLLAAESLIETRRGPHGGASVRAPDPDVVSRQAALSFQLSGATTGDIHLVRSIVEPPAARLLAERRDEAACAQLEIRIDQAQSVRKSAQDWIRAADHFHRDLVELSGNAALALIGRMLSTVTLATYTVSLPLMSSEAGQAAIGRALKSYRQLLDLIRAGDADAAEAHWRRHMAISFKSALDPDTPIRAAVSLAETAAARIAFG
jgi:GntR family transcriptional repressor for pyruvate dehydrogenase complex